MVGHTILRTIVGANLLGTVAVPNLAATLGAKGLLLFLEHLVIETCAQDLQRRLAVLDLRLLILRLHDEPRGKMRDAHGGVGRVDALANTATVAVEVWMRPWLSVLGTRCTRCTPLSNFMEL